MSFLLPVVKSPSMSSGNLQDREEAANVISPPATSNPNTPATITNSDEEDNNLEEIGGAAHNVDSETTVPPSVSSSSTLISQNTSVTGTVQQSTAAQNRGNAANTVRRTWEARKRSGVSPADQCFIEYMQSKKTNGERKEENPDLSFLKSLLPDIALMDPLQKRTLKARFLSVINEILTPPPQSQAVISNYAVTPLTPQTLISNSSHLDHAASLTPLNDPQFYNNYYYA